MQSKVGIIADVSVRWIKSDDLGGEVCAKCFEKLITIEVI